MQWFSLPAGVAALLLLVGSAGCTSSEPTLQLTTSPADATVAVDGFAHPGGSPHTIEFKSAGRYKLTVSATGYQTVEMFVSIGPGERRTQTIELVSDRGGLQIADPPDDVIHTPPPLPPPDNPPIEVASGTFTVNVTSTPSGAMVTVREPGHPESVPVGTTPLTTQMPNNRATEVSILLAGYREHKRLVVAPANGGPVNLDVALSKKAGGGNPIPGPGPLIQDPPPPIVDTGAHGYLSVNTNPWTVVHVDGKSVGNTPVVRLRVKAGRHTVLMENRDLGKRRKKTINVRRDEHVRIVERLD